MEALDEAARIVRVLMSESIGAFVAAETRFPIADRLLKFGPAIIPLLERLLDQPIDDDARDHTAALLVELGSATGVPHLVSLLEHRSPHSILAAIVLGKARVKEAIPLIRRILDEWDCAVDPYTAATLIGVLKKLDAPTDSLKASLRRRWPMKMKPGLEELMR